LLTPCFRLPPLCRAIVFDAISVLHFRRFLDAMLIISPLIFLCCRHIVIEHMRAPRRSRATPRISMSLSSARLAVDAMLAADERQARAYECVRCYAAAIGAYAQRRKAMLSAWQNMPRYACAIMAAVAEHLHYTFCRVTFSAATLLRSTPCVMPLYATISPLRRIYTPAARQGCHALSSCHY